MAGSGAATLTRRGFVAGGGALALAATTAGADPVVVAAAKRARKPLLRGGRFSSGVAAGRPHTRGALLWTRVEGVERGGRVALEVARDPGFRDVLVEQRVLALPERDFTARALVLSKKLKPGREYFYRFRTRSANSPVGRLRTLRPPDSREPVRIGFFSCQAWPAGYYTAHAGLAREDLDLVVSLGDYVYELSGDRGPRTDTIGPDRNGEAQTLAEYRQKYNLYQSDPNLQAMHAAHPFLPTWDDHEVESSWYGSIPGSTQGRPRRVPFEERKRNGTRAFFEHLPIARFKDAPDRVYRNLRLGANAELFLTDLHSHATAGIPCQDGRPQIGPASLLPCEEAKQPGRSMLGAAQKEWLTRGISGSGAAWKLWGTSVMLMALDNAPGSSFQLGEWDGWEAERAEVLTRLADRGTRDVAAFAGDNHTFFAGQVTTTGRSGGRPVGTEFVCGAISSRGIGDFAGDQSRDQAAALTERVTALNPHLAFTDHRHRGYAVVEATQDELRVDFRAPQTVFEPKSEVFTLKRFRVASGRPVVDVV